MVMITSRGKQGPEHPTATAGSKRDTSMSRNMGESESSDQSHGLVKALIGMVSDEETLDEPPSLFLLSGTQERLEPRIGWQGQCDNSQYFRLFVANVFSPNPPKVPIRHEMLHMHPKSTTHEITQFGFCAF